VPARTREGGGGGGQAGAKCVPAWMREAGGGGGRGGFRPFTASKSGALDVVSMASSTRPLSTFGISTSASAKRASEDSKEVLGTFANEHIDRSAIAHRVRPGSKKTACNCESSHRHRESQLSST
jgi:hypothetical protein